MIRFGSPLNHLKIASPCRANWDEMYGDNRKRFCGECKLNVYNLSGMTRDDADALIINAEGRLCVRYYMRPDGSVITEDCPVGWAKVKQRTKLMATAFASMIVALFSGVLFASFFSRAGATIGEIAMPAATPLPRPLMGKPANRPSPTPEVDRIEMKGGLSLEDYRAPVDEPTRPKKAKNASGQKHRR
jgi:hypothetical protein